MKGGGGGREFGYISNHTFGDRLGIGHAHIHLHAAVSREVGPRDQAGRHGDNLTGTVQLALPPLGAQKLDEFGRAVKVEAGITVGLDGILKGAYIPM